MSEERLNRIVAGANRAVEAASNPNYVKLVESTLSLVAPEVVDAMGPDEPVDLVAIAEIDHDGRQEPGVLLICPDRVVVAWSSGIRRPQTHLQSMPRDRLEVSTSLRKAGMMRGWRTDVELRNQGSVRLAAYDESTGVIGGLIVSLLDDR